MRTTTARPTRPRRLLGRALLALAALLLVLAAVLVANTLRYTAPAPEAATPVDLRLGDEAAVARLAGALRFATISHQDPAQTDSGAFRALHAYLQQTFPRVHAALNREVVSGLSLLYRWPGRDPARAPVVLLAHQDVVPVDTSGGPHWRYPPFEGTVGEGAVWGRGALDNKSSVVGILEAVERLLEADFAPERTVYLAFGHDEEVGGHRGARALVARLSEQGVRPAFVLDEGGAVMEGVVPGVAGPVALIGVAEKGYLSLELSVEAPSGHSSQPPAETAIGLLSRAITRLEDHPFPARLDGATAAMFDRVAPHFPFGQRLVFANRWLFDPLLRRVLVGNPSTAATVRTTIAPTIVSAGFKDNVLPARATAVVNFRIVPGERVEGVEARVRETLGDARVRLRRLDNHTEPSPVSSSTSAAYRLIERSLREVYEGPSLVVAPFLLVGGTDARHYAALTPDVYRFNAFTLGPEDLRRFHGTDERLAVGDYARIVRFYYQLLRNTSALPEPPAAR